MHFTGGVDVWICPTAAIGLIGFLLAPIEGARSFVVVVPMHAVVPSLLGVGCIFQHEGRIPDAIVHGQFPEQGLQQGRVVRFQVVQKTIGIFG